MTATYPTPTPVSVRPLIQAMRPVLAALPKPRRGVNPDLRHILLAVQAVTKQGMFDITGPSRRRRIVRARQIFYYLARRLTRRSLPAIGEYCGGRHHSTVMHGIQCVSDRRDYFEPALSILLDHFGAGEDWP